MRWFSRKISRTRTQIISQFKGCFNCLKSGHSIRNCQSKGRCVYCSRSHHSLLHRENSTSVKNNDISSGKVNNNALPENASSSIVATTFAFLPTASVQTVHALTRSIPTVPLATAWVRLRTAENRVFKKACTPRSRILVLSPNLFVNYYVLDVTALVYRFIVSVKNTAALRSLKYR